MAGQLIGFQTLSGCMHLGFLRFLFKLQTSLRVRSRKQHNIVYVKGVSRTCKNFVKTAICAAGKVGM